MKNSILQVLFYVVLATQSYWIHADSDFYFADIDQFIQSLQENFSVPSMEYKSHDFNATHLLAKDVEAINRNIFQPPTLVEVNSLESDRGFERSPLQNDFLEQLRLVGVLHAGTIQYAIIRASDESLYQATLGELIGREKAEIVVRAGKQAFLRFVRQLFHFPQDVKLPGHVVLLLRQYGFGFSGHVGIKQQQISSELSTVTILQPHWLKPDRPSGAEGHEPLPAVCGNVLILYSNWLL